MARIAGIDLPKTKEELSVLLTSMVLEEHFFRNFEKRWYQRRQESQRME
jgi:hypothetical protein